MTDIPARYARQAVLPAIGAAGQARLAAASVLVIGAGGLGSHVLLALAGAGVGRLIVVDHDRVDVSNLHRQPLYRMADLGRPKVGAARDALAAYNPDVTVEARAERLRPGNVAALVAGMDLVVDAADSLAVTYLLSDACRAASVPLVTASVLEEKGYAAGFCGNAPSYRAVFPDMPILVGSCAENGVTGPAVAMLGALQAQMAMQALLGATPSPLGRLVSIDLATYAFGGFHFDGAPEPDEPTVDFIEPRALAEGDTVIELRDVTEAPVAATPQALRLPPEAIAGGAALPASNRLVFACRTGVRAFRTARLVQARDRRAVAVLMQE